MKDDKSIWGQGGCVKCKASIACQREPISLFGWAEIPYPFTGSKVSRFQQETLSKIPLDGEPVNGYKNAYLSVLIPVQRAFILTMRIK